MKILINGINEQLKRPAEWILQLFFDSVEIDLSSTTEPDMTQEQNMTVEPDITVDVQLSVAKVNAQPEEQDVNIFGQIELVDREKRSYRDQQEKSFPLFADQKQETRAFKHVFNHMLLNVLQSYTGIEQPWGILTGIRPTKLLHAMRQEGNSQAEVHQRLRQEYRISEEKIHLMQNIVDQQMKAIPDLHDLKHEVSIYIGIPFCPTKCAYCTFPAYDIKGQQGSVGTFLDGLHYEIEEIGRWLEQRGIDITTIYFGGGTPTSIEAEQMDALYEKMYQSFPATDRIREITVEAGRPDTITPEKINVLKKHHIDRISINPQSYTQNTLEAIGRYHTVQETIEKYQLAREMGISNINMDLIIGLPGEGLKEFENSLQKTEELNPASLTVHTLSFKRASTMTKNKEKYRVAEREEIKKMMDLASSWTQEHGYHPYYLYRQKNILGNLENVGYAQRGKDSLYNIMIMEEKQTIIGLGCGASSKFIHPVSGKITRFANPKEPRAYNHHYQHYTTEKIKHLEQLFSAVQMT